MYKEVDVECDKISKYGVGFNPYSSWFRRAVRLVTLRAQGLGYSQCTILQSTYGQG